MFEAGRFEELLEFDSKFSKIHDKYERVRFIHNNAFFKEKYSKLNAIQNDSRKNAKQSDKYRDEGNQLYTNRKFIQALEYFNKSICFAPEGSEQLVKGYANRSAVYFSVKLFELSLTNIKMAREAGDSDKLATRLNEREAKCVSELRKLETNPKNEFHGLKPELSYPPHENVPFIANCLDLKVNEKYGRHIVTKCDLKVGDVVAIEQPACVAISSEYRYIVCANCFRENDLDLIPCPRCHSAMFCSPECLAAANDAFHSIECPIIDILDNSNELEDQAYVALRFFALIMKNFDSVDKLIQFTKNTKNCEKNVFNVDYTKETQKTDVLASVLKLAIKPQLNLDSGWLYWISNFTAWITKLLLNLTDLKKLFKSDVEIHFLIDFVYHLNEVALSNCQKSSTFDRIDPKTRQRPNCDIKSHGPWCGIYSFHALVNYSCAPNVHLFHHGTKNVMVAVKPLKSGEQLFCGSSYEHSSEDRETRQKNIRENFMFTCDCLACIKNYPKLEEKDLLENYGFIKPMDHMGLCHEYKIDAILELIPKYCEFLTENSKRFPYNKTLVAENVFISCLRQVYIDELPLGDKLHLNDTNAADEYSVSVISRIFDSLRSFIIFRCVTNPNYENFD